MEVKYCDRRALGGGGERRAWQKAEVVLRRVDSRVDAIVVGRSSEGELAVFWRVF